MNFLNDRLIVNDIPLKYISARVVQASSEKMRVYCYENLKLKQYELIKFKKSKFFVCLSVSVDQFLTYLCVKHLSIYFPTRDHTH